MEYLEYYRIIRERVWLAILTGGLAALAVIAMRLLPIDETMYVARGRMLVSDIAKSDMLLQGSELYIGTPKDDRSFWATVIGWAGPAFQDEVSKSLGLEADARDRYKMQVRATLVGERSNLIEFQCSSTDSGVSEKMLDGLMRLLGGADPILSWQSHKVREAQEIIDTLEKRQPGAEEELAEAQDAIEFIEAQHGGMAPDREADIIETSLSAVQIALQSADLETAGARERSAALAGRPQRTVAAPVTDLGAYERIDDLKQQIMDRELALAEMLTRRTPEHPAVKALRQQIGSLRSRVKSLEKRAETSSGTSTYVQEAAIAASVYAREMASRQELLAVRETELRSRLTQARSDLIEYRKALAVADAVQNRYLQLQSHIASANAELVARQGAANMLTVKAPAKLDRPPRGLTAFAAKLVMGTLAGMGLGVMLIFVLHYIDTTFKNEEDAARLLGYPVLAGILHTDIEVIGQDTQETGQGDGGPRAET